MGIDQKNGDVRSYGIMDLARLIGIQPTLLNKFIQRGKYGLDASAKSGSGQGRERRFADQDLYGVALVYWLFESGLRSETIQYVLNQICSGKLNSRANDAALNLLRSGGEALVVTRLPRTGYAKHPEQKTRLVRPDEATRIVRENHTSSVLVVPVKNLFIGLQAKMRKEKT